MNRSITLLILFLAPIGLCAQSFDLSGTVVDSADARPISGAEISLFGVAGLTATTLPDGTFRLKGTASEGIHAVSAPRAIRKSGVRGSTLFIERGDADGPLSVDRFSGNGVRLGTLHIAASNRPASLGKASAAYVLQVDKPGFVTKSISLSAASGDLDTIRLAQEREETGVWRNVTPPGMDPADLAPTANAFGPGSIAGDPARPSDMYVGGSKSGLWKSADYGRTWTRLNDSLPDITRGKIILVAGTSPATIWAAGFRSIYKSTDGGAHFRTIPIAYDPYSLALDPYDNRHLLSGLHEASGVIESIDGGETWKNVGSGTLGGGVSVYPFFIDTGDSAATRRTWLAIGQNGSSPGRTTDGGATWTTPAGLDKLEHPHGNCQIFQKDSLLWVGGIQGSIGQGVYRSGDYGLNWKRVDSGQKPEAIVWGSRKNVYAMYAWACSGCDIGANFESAPLPGAASWSPLAVPAGLIIGPNSLVSVFNGSHSVFVGLMWANGLWRYVEP